MVDWFVYSLSGCCSHVVGLALTIEKCKLKGLEDIPMNMACTNVPQTWHIPRGKRIAAEPIDTAVVRKKLTSGKARVQLNSDQSRSVK